MYKINPTLFFIKNKMAYLWKLSCFIHCCSISYSRDSFGVILDLLRVFFLRDIMSLLNKSILPKKNCLGYRLSQRSIYRHRYIFQPILICKKKKKVSWVVLKQLTNCFLSNLLGILVIDRTLFYVNLKNSKILSTQYLEPKLDWTS